MSSSPCWISDSPFCSDEVNLPRASRTRASSSPGPAGVQNDVVHAPVGRNGGQTTFGDDEQDRQVRAGGLQHPAQTAGAR